MTSRTWLSSGDLGMGIPSLEVMRMQGRGYLRKMAAKELRVLLAVKVDHRRKVPGLADNYRHWRPN